MTGLVLHVTLTSTTDGGMLLDERTGRMFHLNTSGHEIVRASIDGGSEEAVERLRTRYGLSPEHARREVETLLGDLVERGLMHGGGR